MRKFRMGALCALLVATYSGAAMAAPCDGVRDQYQPILPDTPLTLDMVLAQVRQAAPEVRRAGLETMAREAEARQANRWLNPSIGVEVENFSGTGPLSGFDQSETTISIEQTFQLGGKRHKRARVARAKAALGAAECRAILRETELQAALTYYDLLAAQQLAELADQSATLAQSLADIVAKRVAAGAAAPPELARAKAEAASLKAVALGARAEVSARRYDLAALWGEAEPMFGKAVIESAQNYSGEQIAIGTIEAHPSLTVAKASTTARQAELKAARAAMMPDVSVSAAMRQFEQTGDNAFVVGVSLPIPLFDRNRDGSRAAKYRTQAQTLDKQAVEARLRARQQAVVAQVKASQARLTILQSDALPAARAAYDASVKGYAAGRYNLTTTLDARKGLIDAGVALINAKRDFNADLIELKSLIGVTPFDGEF